MNHTCFLCGGIINNTELIITKPDRFEIAVGISDLDYVRYWKSCNNCGLFHNLNSEENQKLISQISEKYYDIDFGKNKLEERFNNLFSLPDSSSDNYHRVIRIKNYFSNQFPKIISNGSKLNLLDIGSGLGIFLVRFISDEWNVVGIEPDPIAFEHLAKLAKSKFKVINSVFEPGIIEEKFNLITFNKVLEHIKDPIPLLKEAKNRLFQDYGIIYVEVPDLDTCFKRKSDDNILGSLHYNLYSPHSLSLLFKNAGLTTLKVERIIEPSGKITTYGFATNG